MAPPTLILITGYARSGKDTLAGGILAGAATPHFVKLNFADFLKSAANTFMQAVGLFIKGDRDFNEDDFKIRKRKFLVDAGTFARSINVDVFANLFVRKCENAAAAWDDGIVVVCSDWRYVNEYKVARGLESAGWRIITIRIDTTGIDAANEEEGQSIGAITREIPIGLSYSFQPASKDKIHAEGIFIARQLGI